MKRLVYLLLFFTALSGRAQDPAPAGNADTTTAAAAAVATGHAKPQAPDFLEHLVDATLEIFDVRSSENTVTHYGIAAFFLVGAFLLRRVVASFVFGMLKKIASRTKTTLDDRLFSSLEGPVTTFIMLTGIFAALKVLKLSASTDKMVGYGSTVAFSLVLFWGLLRAFDALLDHAQEFALKKQKLRHLQKPMLLRVKDSGIVL